MCFGVGCLGYPLIKIILVWLLWICDKSRRCCPMDFFDCQKPR